MSDAELKDKIFTFGIYGKRVETLPEDLVEVAASKPWVEILSPEQAESFAAEFTLAPFVSHNELPVPPGYFLRMNLQAWRAYLFGTSFITTNPQYFFIVDHLLTNPGYASWTSLRTAYGIDPKTLYYLCKRLREMNLTEEKKEGSETYIRLSDLHDRTKQQIVETPVLGDEVSLDTSKLVFFKGVALINQLGDRAQATEGGVGTKELSETTGVTLKNALKHMQRLCEMRPDRFKMVDTIEHGHTVFKVFSAENLAKRNKKKLETMKTAEGTVDPVLSAKDRQNALKLLAEKHGHFVISKPIFEEIAKMTGYPYSIDRKNLVHNAAAAGLKVFKLRDAPSKRYVVADPQYDEAILSLYAPPDQEKGETAFFKSIRKYFMNLPRFVAADNGYTDLTEIQHGVFFTALLEIFPGGDQGSGDQGDQRGGDAQGDDYRGDGVASGSRQDGGVASGPTTGSTTGSTTTTTTGFAQFDFQSVMKMKFKPFFRVTSIKKPCFLVNCTHTIADPSLELFLSGTRPRKINPEIYTLMDGIDLEMGEVLRKLPVDFQEIIRREANPVRYQSKLQALFTQGLIDLQVDELGRFFIKILKRDFQVPAQCKTFLLGPGLLNYNVRAEFVKRLEGTTRETFKKAAEDVMREIFTRTEIRTMQKAIDHFLKEEMIEKGGVMRSKDRFISKPPFILREEHRDLYLRLKKALIFGQPIDFRVLNGYENSDIDEVLEYMAKKKIVAGYRSLATLSRTYLNKKIKAYLSLANEGRGEERGAGHGRGEGEETRAERGEWATSTSTPSTSTHSTSTHSTTPPSDEEYYDLLTEKVYSVTKELGSADLDQLVTSMRYFEPFEISAVLERHPEKFLVREVDGFKFVSPGDLRDPFAG